MCFLVGKLFRQLRDKEIYAAEIMRRGRSGLPPQIGGPILKKEDKGSWRWTRDGDRLYLVWVDNSLPVFCSTLDQGSSKNRTVKRKGKGTGK